MNQISRAKNKTFMHIKTKPKQKTMTTTTYMLLMMTPWSSSANLTPFAQICNKRTNNPLKWRLKRGEM